MLHDITITVRKTYRLVETTEWELNSRAQLFVRELLTGAPDEEQITTVDWRESVPYPKAK